MLWGAQLVTCTCWGGVLSLYKFEHIFDIKTDMRIKCSSTLKATVYSADPRTKAWLSSHLDPVFGYPTVVRFSWATCRDILDSKAVDVRWWVNHFVVGVFSKSHAFLLQTTKVGVRRGDETAV